MAATRNTDIKLLFWNCRSLKQRVDEIQATIRDTDILICVETWLTPQENINFPGFITFRKDRIYSRGGGIAIFVRNNLAFQEISNLTTPSQSVEICGIQINNIQPPLDLLVCYRTPGHTLTQNEWNTIIKNMKTTNCIFMGDFNAHHINWNCRHTDSNGDRLSYAIDLHDHYIHNTNSLTHVDVHRNIKSNIDLILSSLNISDIVEVSVCDETWGSDHYPIYISVNIEKSVYKKKSFKLKSLRTNWSKVATSLEDSFAEFNTNHFENLSPNDKYDFFVNKVRETVKSCTPIKKETLIKAPMKNPVPWWDAECNKAKRLRKAAYKKWVYTNNEEDLINYKRTCAIVKRTLKKKKTECFRNFAEKINLRTDPNFVWNKCKIFKNSWVKIKPNHSSENLQDRSKTDSSLTKLCPPWAQTNPSWLPPSSPNDFFDLHFTFSELNAALENKKIKSASGIDGIDFEIVKNLPLKFKLLLLDIYNLMYQKNNYPQSWKESFIHFIKKPDGNGLRPISLTSCLCKLFETLIKNRLQWWAESRNLLPSSQFGFRKGKSCLDNITNLTLKVDEAFSQKKEVLAAFLDVQGAFDNVSIDILLAKLASFGCSTNLIKFVKFISHERLIFSADSGDEFSVAYKGVPQGGVLSPLLFILYVANITDGMQKTVHVSQFADDIAIYLKIAKFNKGKKMLEKSINILSKNLRDIGLILTPNKTTFLHFNNKNILPGSTEISIQNISVESSNTARFLGIIFDYKLSFNPQVDQVIKKCSRALNVIKYLCGTWWGSDPETLLILYKSLVRSIIEYGCFAYYPTRNDTAYKLEKIQHVAIRAALGYRKTTPTNILLAESKIPLIRERATFLCNCFLAKTISISNSPTLKAITSYNNITKNKARHRLISNCISSSLSYSKQIESQKHLNVYTHDFETLYTSISIDTELGHFLNKSNKPSQTFSNFVDNQNAFSIYTDGSKIQGSNYVGSACICHNLGIFTKKSLDINASVFTAECAALKDALDLAICNKQHNFLIFSDSLSALQSLQSLKTGIRTNSYILEIKKKYNIFLKENTNSFIKFYWIPSHIGIRGNEDADRLAKDATSSATSDITQIPFTDFYEQFRKNMKIQTNNSIKDQGLFKGKTYFLQMFNDSDKSWFANKKLPREFIVTINRSRADHYHLAASLFRMNIVNSPTCKCNEADENLNHVIWQCKLFASQRDKLLTSLKKYKIHPPLCIESLIAKPDIRSCKLIQSFFKDINLRI